MNSVYFSLSTYVLVLMIIYIIEKVTPYLKPNVFSRPPLNLTYEDRMSHEQLDVQMIMLIKEQVLPRAAHTPNSFITHVMELLNRGSVHATAPQPLTSG